MKKSNFFKTVLGVAAAMLISSSVFAQPFPALPYGAFNVDPANGLTHDANTDYVTTGKTMGYYALPDPIYNPNYATLGTLGGGTWTWTVPAGVTVDATPTVVAPNYVELQYGAPGTYDVTVAENAPAAMGGCVGSLTYLHVIVIGAPTGTASINPGGTWSAITAGQAYQICSAQAAQTVTVAFNEDVPDNLASYAFQITETKELLDGLGAVIATPQAETVVQDFPSAGKLKTGTVGVLPSATFNAATPAFTFTFLTDALAVLQNAGVDARTRYTYKVTRTGDATQNGFYSNISQKSDFIAASIQYYNFTNQTVSFIVNPAPATGPIYYVPNNFNY